MCIDYKRIANEVPRNKQRGIKESFDLSPLTLALSHGETVAKVFLRHSRESGNPVFMRISGSPLSRGRQEKNPFATASRGRGKKVTPQQAAMYLLNDHGIKNG